MAEAPQAVEKARLTATFSDENCRFVCAGGANSPPAWVLRTSKAPDQLPTVGQPGDTISFGGATAPPNHPQIGLSTICEASARWRRPLLFPSVAPPRARCFFWGRSAREPAFCRRALAIDGAKRRRPANRPLRSDGLLIRSGCGIPAASSPWPV